MKPSSEKSDATRTHSHSTLHRQTLVKVNISVHTGRRNAAHAQAVETLRDSMSQSSMDTKRQLAMLGKKLIDEALLCTQRSLASIDAPPLQYLKILRDTIAAHESLITHEIELTKADGKLASILGDKLNEQLAAFNTVELSNVKYIEELFKFGIPLMEQDTQERLAGFSEDDRRRYHVAVDEFKHCYELRKNEILLS